MTGAGWIAIRADGSAQMGTGHIMRCLTLADAVARRGMGCVFVCRHLDGSLPQWLRRAGHEVIDLAKDGPQPCPDQGSYGDWLGTTQAHDAEAMLGALAAKRRQSGDPMLVLVDHYGLGREWEERVAAGTGVAIAAIDDLDRAHACDFLIDATYGKDADHYRGKVPQHCVVMAGAQYALLRPGFAEIRDETLARRDAAFAAGEPVRDLLIAMGGADIDNTTAWVLEAIRPLAEQHRFHTHVLIGAAYPHHETLRSRMAAFAAPLTVHRDIADVPRLLARMDLCVGAAGSSTWERCCLGLPTLNVVLADNQRQAAAALLHAGAVADGGKLGFGGLSQGDWTERYLAPPLMDSETRRALSFASRVITEGRGTTLVVSKILGPIAHQDDPGRRAPQGEADKHGLRNRVHEPLEFKPLGDLSEAELLQILSIRNEPGIRRNMYTDHEIGRDEHMEWAERQKSSSASAFYAVLHRQEIVGAASLSAISKSHRRADWAFYLSVSARGQGIGSSLEAQFIDMAFAKYGLEKLNCEVISFNEAVIKMHQRFGFQIEGIRRDHVIRDGQKYDSVLLGITAAEWAASGI